VNARVQPFEVGRHLYKELLFQTLTCASFTKSPAARANLAGIGTSEISSSQFSAIALSFWSYWTQLCCAKCI
jgi:hypothetical protein